MGGITIAVLSGLCVAFDLNAHRFQIADPSGQTGNTKVIESLCGCDGAEVLHVFQNALTLCHINYYDAEGNIIATDGCSNHPIDSTDNERIDLHVEPRINAPKSITWDHLEVFWMYTLPDYSAG